MRPALSLLSALTGLAACAVAVAGCDSAASDAPPSFGDPYKVVVSDGSPRLADGVLTVDVGYAGGCEDHAFVVRSRADGEAAEVWLVHDGRGDACEQAQTATLRETLPSAVADAERVTLLAPFGPALPLRGAGR